MAIPITNDVIRFGIILKQSVLEATKPSNGPLGPTAVLSATTQLTITTP